MVKPVRESYIENDYAEFWIEDGVIMQMFKPHMENITLPIAKEIVRDRLKVSNGVTMPLLIDSGKTISMDKEARDFFVTDYAVQYLDISAIVVHNMITLYLGKLFLAFGKPKFKVELFKTRARALAFLKGLNTNS